MANAVKLMMRTANAASVWVYRRSGGRVLGKVKGVPVLLLTVAGRTSGLPHTTVVSYFESDGRYVVSGSAGGAPEDPQWFRNLRHAHDAVIEVGPRKISVAVSIAGAQERETLWNELLVHAPFFAGYQEKVERQIPMAILTPTG